MFNVKVARVPGETKEITMDGEQATIADVLAAAKVTLENGESLKLGGLPTTPDTMVSNGMRITLVRGAKGN